MADKADMADHIETKGQPHVNAMNPSAGGCNIEPVQTLRQAVKQSWKALFWCKFITGS